jgi:hypothetical protein
MTGPIGVTPITSFPASVFYDANNNPLNIPCEGARLVQVNLDPNVSFNYTIDLSQMQQQGQFSALQSMFIDMADFNVNISSGDQPLVNFTIVLSGSNQRIITSNVNQGETASVYASGLYVPVIAVNPPRLSVNINFVNESPAPGMALRLTLYNFMVPPSALSMVTPPFV